MLRFLITRLSLVIPTFIGMTLLAFFLIRLVPGDPIETMAGERGIDPERHAALLKEYGLDRPVLVQYGIYIVGRDHGDKTEPHVEGPVGFPGFDAAPLDNELYQRRHLPGVGVYLALQTFGYHPRYVL